MPNDDRAILLGLAATMKISLGNAGPRRDACGDYRLEGKNGHVYVDGDGFLVFLQFTDQPRMWTHAKHVLDGEVTQNGNDEGCIWIAGGNAEIFRRIIGFRKRLPATVADHLRTHRFQS